MAVDKEEVDVSEGKQRPLLTELDEFTYERGARSLNRLSRCIIPIAYLVILIIYFTKSAKDME